MNKRILYILVVAVAALALTSNTVAQPQPDFVSLAFQPPSTSTTPAIGTYLSYPGFAKELELTPQQVSELRKIQTEAIETRARIMGYTLVPGYTPAHGNPGGIRRPTEEENRRLEAARIEQWAKVDKVLNPAQRTKLSEIVFQSALGLEARSLNEWNLEVLNLTDAQKEQVRKLVKERDTELSVIMQRSVEAIREQRLEPEYSEVLKSYRATVEKIRLQYNEQIKSLLTAEQRAKAEKLTAEAPAVRERLGLRPQLRVPVAER